MPRSPPGSKAFPSHALPRTLKAFDAKIWASDFKPALRDENLAQRGLGLKTRRLGEKFGGMRDGLGDCGKFFG
eukprot:229361-Rhodomonas_salina.1